MEKTFYLIKINDLFYGKENKTHGRILNPMYCKDENDLMYLIEEIGYTTDNGAKKAYKKILDKLKKENKTIKESRIDGIIIKR